MSAFCSLSDVKSFMAITGTQDDPLLTSLIQAASNAMETVMNRTVAAASYTDLVDGNGKAGMMLSNWPVISVTSVTIDGTSVPASTGYGASGYAQDENVVFLRNRVFTKGARNVSIVYQAGWATVPDDLKQACVETVALKYRQKEYAGYRSKSLAGETVSFDKGDFPDSVERILNNYKKVVPW
ncbi:MAG: head-tail connector protein [Burkholderiales bacterium]